MRHKTGRYARAGLLLGSRMSDMLSSQRPPSWRSGCIYLHVSPRALLLAVWSALLSVVWVVPSAMAANDSPFLMPKKEFRKSIKSVAAVPLAHPRMLAIPAQRVAYIEEQVQQALQKTGLAAVPMQAYRSLRAHMSEQIGGLNNADGEFDAQRQRLVWDHARREMLMRHDMDAFAHVSLVSVSAVFQDDRAEWDGIKQKVKKSGDGFSLFGGKNYQGSIAALSLQLAIYSRAEQLLFVQRAGIEVLQERQAASLVPLPANELLQDDKRIRKAVQRVFKAL